MGQVFWPVVLILYRLSYSLSVFYFLISTLFFFCS
jgi:hypothetical protein